MSQGIESHVDWTAPSKSHRERAGSGLNGRQDRQAATSAEKRDVMDTLLGKNNLTAADLSGNDPYNTTGRYFRR